MQLRGEVLADTSHEWPPDEALYLETLDVGEAEIVTRKEDVDSSFTNTFNGAIEQTKIQLGLRNKASLEF